MASKEVLELSTKLRKRRMKIVTVGATFYVDMWERDLENKVQQTAPEFLFIFMPHGTLFCLEEHDATSKNIDEEPIITSKEVIHNSDCESCTTNLEGVDTSPLEENDKNNEKMSPIMTAVRKSYEEPFSSENMLEMNQLEDTLQTSQQFQQSSSHSSNFSFCINDENQHPQEYKDDDQLQNNPETRHINIPEDNYKKTINGDVFMELRCNIPDVIAAKFEYKTKHPRLICSLCQKDFNRKDYLRAHMLTHNKGMYFQCEFEGCQKKYVRQKSFEFHIRSHTADKRYKCPYKLCQRLFFTSTLLNKHIFSHVNLNYIPKEIQIYLESQKIPFWVCNICGKTFDKRKALDGHKSWYRRKTSHVHKKLFQCEYEGCQMKFVRVSSLKYHRRIHIGDKPYKCPYRICQKLFSSYNNLLNHACTHIRQNDIPSEIQSFLEIHKTTLWTCNICGKIFYGKTKLEVHKSSHIKEKVFQCMIEECWKEFTSSNDLKKHMEIHPEYNYLKCPLHTCNKMFLRKYDYLIHGCIHLNDKNCPDKIREKIRNDFYSDGLKHYICASCGYIFGKRDQFQKHILKHNRFLM